MKQLLIATYWLVMALSTEASELTGKVVSVSDGDTLRVLVDDQQIKIRLGGIDAPESDQPFGQAVNRVSNTKFRSGFSRSRRCLRCCVARRGNSARSHS